MSYTNAPNSRRLTGGVVLALLGLSVAWFHLDEALWNDEIYTLKYFVDRGLGTVLTDYHVPNNHVLANIGHWLWSRLVGSLDTALDRPWPLRLWPALISLAAVLVAMRAARRAWGETAGWLAGLLLLSTLAFGNFAFQLRGYPLSLLLGAGLLALGLYALNDRPFGARQATFAALLTAGLLYTIPSNLYYILALSALVPLAIDWSLRRAAAFWWLGGCAAGILLALLLYAPMLAEVLHNPYIDGGSGGAGETGRNFLGVLAQFTGWRYLLLPLAGWGWYVAARQGGTRRRQLVLLAGALLVPFLLSALRGDTPPMRIFLVQLPAFILLLTLGWSAALDTLTTPPMRRGLLVAGTVVCLGSYAYAVSEARERLRHAFESLARDQELSYTYYQFWYAPDDEFRLFKQRFPGKKVVIETSEPYDIPVFLEHFGISSAPLDSIENFIRARQTMYVSTRYPKNFIREMEKLSPRWHCSYLQPQDRYPRIVICAPR